MALDSGASSRENFASLQGCLAEGDPEQRARERRIRRHALVISITLQGLVLTALVLVPLFGRTGRIALANPIPIPPYYPHSNPAQPSTPPAPPRRAHFTPLCGTCAQPRSPMHIPTTNSTPPQDVPSGFLPGGDRGNSQPGWGINIDDGRSQPARPVELRQQPPRRVVITNLEPAMLIHRVEPVYPILPKQMGREGRVELHAIIATNGTIQFLQVVGGDALFFQSALDAVRQWRYRPTILNGQPVEVDTSITVIYSMKR